MHCASKAPARVTDNTARNLTSLPKDYAQRCGLCETGYKETETTSVSPRASAWSNFGSALCPRSMAVHHSAPRVCDRHHWARTHGQRYADNFPSRARARLATMERGRVNFTSVGRSPSVRGEKAAPGPAARSAAARMCRPFI